MLKTLNELFVKTLKLSPEIWLYILIAVVGVAFLITLLTGLLSGEFKKVKSLMKRAAANPKTTVAIMQKMPVGIKKQYKRARLGGMEPSMLVTEDMCVETPYKRSVLSKLWIVTFVATVVCAAIGYVVAPLALQTLKDTELKEAFNINALYLLPVTVLLIGGLLTFIGAIVSRCAHGGAVKAYAKFVAAIDGGDGGAQHNDREQAAAPQAPVFAADGDDHAVVFEAPEETQAEPVENVQNDYFADGFGSNDAVAEPVAEPVAAVVPEESDEEIRRRAREEALMRARAEQEEQLRAAAEAKAAAEAQAQAQAQAEARARAEAQAQRAAQAQAQAQPAGSSSADDIIARIEQIDREGAPRETMREVATLLQKERAKPENKTPEQQKKLNEALSKLLKAMTAASRK